MDWVRIHPMIVNWPGGGPPPVFDISADENGSVVVELAWDPQALLAPATYSEPLRYYSTDVLFDEHIQNDDGSTRAISLPAQTISLANNQATWTIPADLWAGYMEESLKTMNTPPTTTFSRNLYYRVRVTAPGSSAARVWPDDASLRGPNAQDAPHIGILPVSASPSSQVFPDQTAVEAMGGIPLLPSIWSQLLTLMWQNLPESNPERQALVRIFAHESFQGADLQTRAAVLKLWLFAGPKSRQRIPQLLNRNAVTGSNIVQPVITKADLKDSKTLVENLLALLSIIPHPDLAGAVAKEQLLDDVITEILDPNGQINQGAAGTCSPTSIQTLLITVNPSEYARLQVGLLSRSGSARLANGDSISLPPSVLQIANYASGIAGNAFLVRTYSELAFQAAMIKYAQGNRFPAFNGSPGDIAKIFQQVIQGGLYNSETKKALDGLFGVNFTTREIPWPPQPTVPAFQTAQQAVRDRFLSDLPALQQQMILAMFWGAPYGNPSPPGGGHAVMAVRREQGPGKVFYKNPQYPGSKPPAWIVQGGTANNPPRRYEDPTQSLESIAESDLNTWIFAYWVPDAAII